MSTIPTDPAIDPADPADPVITLPANDPVPAPAPTNRRRQQTFTAEDIERARQEEKDKLYARLGKVDELQEALRAMQEREAAAEKARKDAEKEADKARKDKEREEMSAKDLIEATRVEWEQKLQAEAENRQRLEIILQKEREVSNLQAYLSQKMVAVADGTDEFPAGIMPQLRAFVAGNSQEEIDASIFRAQQTTAEILGEFSARQNGQRAMQPTARVTSPPVGPMELTDTGSRSFTLQELKDMPLEEYRQYSERLKQEASRMYKGR